MRKDDEETDKNIWNPLIGESNKENRSNESRERIYIKPNA